MKIQLRAPRTIVINLTDGTTIVGRPAFSWRPSVYRVTSAVLHDPSQASPERRAKPTDGVVMVPRERVLFVQLVSA
jgi:hypothetical protein